MEPTEFADRATAAAADLSLFFAGMPDDKITSTLKKMRTNLANSLAKPFAPAVASQMADAFVRAIAYRRHEIEGLTTTRTAQ
jgi:hypothetical protein